MSLFDRRLIILGGKGGVGRTTVAAALALAAARRHKRVLLAQTKSKERLSRLFGVPQVGSELTRVADNVFAVNMTPPAALREYGTMVLRSGVIARQVLEDKVSRAFWHAIPGLGDYSMLGKVWFHTTEMHGNAPRWDLTILDGPATGHLVTMLQIPQAILDAVPEGPLTRPAVAMQELLHDAARTAMVLVTLAEDLPSNEAIELSRRAQERLHIAQPLLVVNALYPPRFSHGVSARALAALPEDLSDAQLAPLLASARTAQRRRALNDHYVERLHKELAMPQAHLPYLFTAEFGRRAVMELSERLEGQVMALGWAARARGGALVYDAGRMRPLALAALLLLAAPARAGETYALFRLDPLGIDPGIVSQLERILRVEVTRVVGRELPSPRAVADVAAREPRLANCTADPSCLGPLSRALKVTRVVAGNVGGLADSYVVNLKLVDDNGKELRRVSATLRGSPDELIDEIRVAAVRLIAPERLVGSIAILSDVPGATVALDGNGVGKTPLPAPLDNLPTGVHRLDVTRDGFTPFAETVPVRFEKTTQVVVRQSAMSAAARKAERRRRAAGETPIYTRWYFWTGVAVTAIATGVAIGFAIPKQGAIDCARATCP